MGTDYHVYVGPYIEAHNPEKDSFLERYGCPNDKCHLHKREASSKFCPSCGTGIALVSVPQKTRIRFDAYAECDERICESFHYMPEGKEDYNVFVSNTKGHGQHLDGYCNIVPVDVETVKSQLDKFKVDFAADIDKVKAAFGEAAVKVYWGVLSYTS
jgi:hypothetical protein